MLEEKPTSQIVTELVKKVLERYQRGERDFARINLENANLNQVDLAGVNLSKANLRGAKLSHANLSGANLSRADLQSADLSQANLGNANLYEAKLDAADLSAANLIEANLNYAYMARIKLCHADLREAELRGADLTAANLEQCTLTKANLSGARLRKANLQAANLKQAYLQKCNLQLSNLTGANLQKADLTKATFDGAILTQTDLREAEIAKAKEINLESAILGKLDNEIEHTLHLELQVWGIPARPSLAFSPNSDIFAYCDPSGDIVSINLHTSEKITKIDIQSEAVVSVVFDSDNYSRILYRYFYVNELKMWNPLTGELIKSLKNHSVNYTSIVFNKNAECIGMIGTGEPFELIDVGHEVRTFKGYSSGIQTSSHSPDGRFTARSAPDVDGQVEIIDRQTGKRCLFIGHQAPVQSLAFSPDCKFLASASPEDTKIWQIETRTEITNREKNIRYYRHDFCPRIAFTQMQDSEHPVLISSDFFSSYEQMSAKASGKDGIKLEFLSGVRSNCIPHVAISANRKVLARLYNDDQPVQLWNLQTGQELSTLSLDFDYHCPPALNPTGEILAVSSGREFALWDVQTKKLIYKFIGHSGNIEEIVFSQDGLIVASGGYDCTIKLWNLQTGCEIKSLRAYSTIKALTFSPVEPILASGGTDGTIKLWDLKTMEEIYSFKGNKGDTQALAFSPDGKWLASGDRSTIRLWKFNRTH